MVFETPRCVWKYDFQQNLTENIFSQNLSIPPSCVISVCGSNLRQVASIACFARFIAYIDVWWQCFLVFYHGNIKNNSYAPFCTQVRPQELLSVDLCPLPHANLQGYEPIYMVIKWNAASTHGDHP